MDDKVYDYLMKFWTSTVLRIDDAFYADLLIRHIPTHDLFLNLTFSLGARDNHTYSNKKTKRRRSDPVL